MGASAMPKEAACRWYQQPVFWGGLLAVVFVIFNIVLW
jgi:hypothetical protein